MRTCLPLLASLLPLFGCGSAAPGPDLPAGVEARSIDGQELERISPDEAGAALYGAALKDARARWEAERLEDDAIWVGRNLAYLGRYREAIEWYGDRLRDFPASARLRRHRGHRYLSTRQLDLAIADFEAAWSLLEGTADRVEPDGAPNAYGIPRSTTHTNVLYHLGLAHYLQGDWERAAEVLDDCRARCSNDDMLVATLNWQVHALRRAGRHAQARELLAGVSAGMDVIENHVYLRLLLLQRGELLPDQVLPARDRGVQDATALYGVATWSYCNGNHPRAQALWRAIVARTPWNAFGHLAAEADLVRLR